MKQGLSIQDSLVPGTTHYVNTSKGSFSKNLIVFLFAFFLLFITGYNRNDMQANSQKSDMVKKVLRQGVTIRCVFFKGNSESMGKMPKGATNAFSLQIDNPFETGMGRTSKDKYPEVTALPFPAIVTSMSILTATNGDKIFKTDYGYVQLKKDTKVSIYLL